MRYSRLNNHENKHAKEIAFNESGGFTFAGRCGVALRSIGIGCGGNGAGQPSGSTVAGSTTTPTATMSGLTSVILSGSGPTTASVTTPTSGGGTQTTTTVTVPASSVRTQLGAVGLVVGNDPNTTYVGPSGNTYNISEGPGLITDRPNITIKAHTIKLGVGYTF